MSQPNQHLSEEDKQTEEECKEMAMRYSLPTRMGNWLETHSLREERIRLFSKKIERCETFLQRKGIVTDYLRVKADIAKYNPNLLYDVPVQIAAIIENPSDPPMVLSTIITEKQIENEAMLELSEGCLVTVSAEVERLRRNIFSITGLTPAKSNTPVLYDEEIYVKLYNAESDRVLYFRCEIPNCDTFGGSNAHFPILLSENIDRYNKFKLVPWDSKEHYYLKGKPVPSNSKVCLCHILSNRLIALDEEIICTLMGKEALATCYNYNDARKMVSNKNCWIFITKVIGEDEKKADKLQEAL